MARHKVTLITPNLPGGPMKVGIPAFGGQAPKADRRAAGLNVPRRDHRSKKSFTGTVAGTGRKKAGHPTSNRPGPKGHAGVPFKDVQGRKPSLMTRIGRRLGLGRLFKRRNP